MYLPVFTHTVSHSLCVFTKNLQYTLKKNTTEQKNKEIPGREDQKKPGAYRLQVTWLGS